MTWILEPLWVGSWTEYVYFKCFKFQNWLFKFSLSTNLEKFGIGIMILLFFVGALGSTPYGKRMQKRESMSMMNNFIDVRFSTLFLAVSFE